MIKGSIQQKDIITEMKTQKNVCISDKLKWISIKIILRTQNSAVKTNHLITKKKKKNHGQTETQTFRQRGYTDNRYANNGQCHWLSVKYKLKS